MNRFVTVMISMVLVAFSSTICATDIVDVSGKIIGEKVGESMKDQTVKPIVILGASYAASLKIDALMGRPVINNGIGGNQSFEMLARFNKDVIVLNPEIVILWGFINDIFRSDRSNMATTLKRTKENYIEMINLAEKNGITPILATEVTMSLKPGIQEKVRAFIGKIRGKTGYQEYINKHVIEINEWLKSYATQKNLVLLDLQSQLTDGSIMRKRKYAQEDGSHISDKGYKVISEYLQKKFADLK